MKPDEKIPKPYVVFTGDAPDYKQAKVACGVVEWRPEYVVGQFYPEMFNTGLKFDHIPQFDSLKAAKDAGAKTLLIGYSPYERDLPNNIVAVVNEALLLGLNVASGLHGKLSEDDRFLNPTYSMYASGDDIPRIYDFRHREQIYPKGNGLKRTGLRLLTVGTDCACGKKFTALSISRALDLSYAKNTFRSTGQTGFLISESGINNDTIEADFLSGAAEWLSPDNDADHWDIIEGQGALSHPSFCGGSMSLIYGSQPDLIVMCHDMYRDTQRGVTRPIPKLSDEIELVMKAARLVNPNAELGAISLFGPSQPKDQECSCDEMSRMYGVPVFNPAEPNDMFFDFIEVMQRMAFANNSGENDG